MITGYASGILKKFSMFDKDYMIVVFLFIMVLFSAKAFATVSAPDQVVINDKTTFYAEIINNSSEQVDLKVNFFSPLKSEVVAPKTISPNEKVYAKITLYNTKFDQKTQINSTIEANMGDVIEKKEVALSFSGVKYYESGFFGLMFSGLFSFGDFISETMNFSLIEWVVFWILVIVAAVLLVAFVSRVRNRV